MQGEDDGIGKRYFQLALSFSQQMPSPRDRADTYSRIVQCVMDGAGPLKYDLLKTLLLTAKSHDETFGAVIGEFLKVVLDGISDQHAKKEIIESILSIIGQVQSFENC